MSAMPIESGPPPAPAAVAAPDAATPRRSRAVIWLLRLARFPMIVGVASVFATATALLAFVAVRAYELVARLAAPGGMDLPKEELMLATIKLLDLVLLATVLYIMAIGLYGLFIDSRLPVPPWLRIDDIDALKHRLTGVVITVLGVVFLEHAISWDGQRDLLPFGAAVAAVVLALTCFLAVPFGEGRNNRH
jgi:uncharacterized membrane protein YqhA